MSIHVNNIRLAQPIMSFFKIEGFVYKRFLSSPPPPPSFVFLALAPFFALEKRRKSRSSVFLCSQTPRKLVGGYIILGPWKKTNLYLSQTALYIPCNAHWDGYKMVDTLWKSEQTKQKHLINWILIGKAKYVHENMFWLDFKIPDHFIYMSLNKNSDYRYIPGFVFLPLSQRHM